MAASIRRVWWIKHGGPPLRLPTFAPVKATLLSPRTLWDSLSGYAKRKGWAGREQQQRAREANQQEFLQRWVNQPEAHLPETPLTTLGNGQTRPQNNPFAEPLVWDDPVDLPVGIERVVRPIGQERVRANRAILFAEMYGAGPATLNRIVHDGDFFDLEAMAQHPATAEVNRNEQS